MQETTPENALNWRELADQLTLAQIAECEQTPNLTHRLNHARRLVATSRRLSTPTSRYLRRVTS